MGVDQAGHHGLAAGIDHGRAGRDLYLCRRADRDHPFAPNHNGCIVQRRHAEAADQHAAGQHGGFRLLGHRRDGDQSNRKHRQAAPQGNSDPRAGACGPGHRACRTDVLLHDQSPFTLPRRAACDRYRRSASLKVQSGSLRGTTARSCHTARRKSAGCSTTGSRSGRPPRWPGSLLVMLRTLKNS